MKAEKYIETADGKDKGWFIRDRYCADHNIRVFATIAADKAREEMKAKAIEAFCSFVEDYCSESGRKDILAESEHYIEVFKYKLEKEQ